MNTNRYRHLTQDDWNAAVGTFQAVAEWFSVKDRWVPGVAARNAKGESVGAKDEDVTCMCVMGAIHRFAPSAGNGYGAARHALYAAVEKRGNGEVLITAIADASWESCKQLVADALEYAQAQVEKVKG